MNKTITPALLLPTIFAILSIMIIVGCGRDDGGVEHSAIQSIIADIADYQAEIEWWGYHASVLRKGDADMDKFGLTRYGWADALPILILKDNDGGAYCFYNGFDQYIGCKAIRASMMLVPAGQYGNEILCL